MNQDKPNAAVGPNDGGAAFPHVEHRYDGSYWKDYPGMSLRDWFAGQALAGALVGAQGLNSLSKGERETIFNGLAGILFEVADAMLSARAEGDRHA